MDLTEAGDIKKRWQEYKEELYKKDLHDPDNHDDLITNLEFPSYYPEIYRPPTGLPTSSISPTVCCQHKGQNDHFKG